jgi:hypothetical protein
LADLAWLVAGYAGQAQFTVLTSAFHHLTAAELHPTEDNVVLFSLVNGLLFVVPFLFALFVGTAGKPFVAAHFGTKAL